MLCLKVLSEDFSVFREASPHPLGKLVSKLKVSPNHTPEKNRFIHKSKEIKP